MKHLVSYAKQFSCSPHTVSGLDAATWVVNSILSLLARPGALVTPLQKSRLQVLERRTRECPPIELWVRPDKGQAVDQGWLDPYAPRLVLDRARQAVGERSSSSVNGGAEL